MHTSKCGYDVIRRDRNRNGGGVCFYVRSTINYSLCLELFGDQLENLCIEVLIIYLKKFLQSDWAREVQFFGNTVQKRGD